MHGPHSMPSMHLHGGTDEKALKRRALAAVFGNVAYEPLICVSLWPYPCRVRVRGALSFLRLRYSYWDIEMDTGGPIETDTVGAGVE